MKKMSLFSFALAAVMVAGLSTYSVAEPKDSKHSKDAQVYPFQNMMQVLPGTKQTINGSDAQQVRIAREVRHELAMLPYYTLFDDLRYTTDGTTVTLGGYVVNPSLKGDAENAVKGIEGVTNVVNNIELLPPAPADDRIRQATARKIFSFGGLSRYSWEAAPTIHIIVKGGHIFLEGVVDSEGDRDAAGIQANTVPGAFSVSNDLQIATRTKK